MTRFPFRPAALAAALSLAFATGLAPAADMAASAPDAAAATAATASGLDKTGMDASVRPQDSLFSR